MGPRHRISSLATPLIALLLGASTLSQTRITPPANKYTIEQDLKLGQEAAAEARKELPLLGDARVDEYVETVGRRLVGAIQPDLVTPAFRYTFDVVNQKDINAFALPGGPMFLNRGMMEASKSEAEMAGVMAHELAHLLNPRGTHSSEGVRRAHWTPSEFTHVNRQRFSDAEGSSIRQTVRALGGGPMRVAD